MKYKSKNTTKKDILPVFIKLMAERGYEGATCERVAKHFGYQPSALFKHYKSKSHIHLESCKALVDCSVILSPIIESRFIVQSALYKSDECDTVYHLKDSGLYDEVKDSFKVLAANYD
jgi:AcrR family transcriptional regulator